MISVLQSKKKKNFVKIQSCVRFIYFSSFKYAAGFVMSASTHPYPDNIW